MAVRFTLPVLPLWLVLVVFWSNFANAELVVKPKDTVVLVNQPTYFNCSTSVRNISASFVVWYHYTSGSPSRNDVYDEGQIMHEYKNRFRNETNVADGVFNLVVERPTVGDAGRYECQDGVGQGDKASAELIVLERNPICESNMHSDEVVGQNSCGLKPDEFLLTCHITYHGNTPPTLEWKKSGDESSPSLAACERSASCNLTQRGDQITNGQSFICQTANSAEHYGCSIGPIKVKYALSLTEEIAEAKGGVVCSSNTSQPCTYKWYNAKTEEVSADRNLHTTVPGEYICEAQCDMNRLNESCIFIAMRAYIVSPVSDPVSDAQPGLISIPIIICSAVFIIIIIIVVFCLHKHKKKQVAARRALSKDNDDVPMLTPSKENTVLIVTTQDDAARSPLELSAELSSLPNITDQDMVDTLAINQYFIDRGTSGAIYGPFRWKDKKCAIKQILYSPDKVTEEKKKEIDELIDRCKKLDHPHLVKVFEVWFPSPALYIVMEQAEGKSLDKFLRPKEATYPLPLLSPEVVQQWALQIALGMRYLHSNDVVHRNLKAAHVLVMESPNGLPNKLKIGSYTLAKDHDHSTVMSLKGTMAWMAPEYIRGEPFSKLSDVWSYGVTVWEILTRDIPYKEMRKETDLVRAAINKTLELKIPDSCPEPLRVLLKDCWNYEVNKRPSFQKICDYLRSTDKVGNSGIRL